MPSDKSDGEIQKIVFPAKMGFQYQSKPLTKLDAVIYKDKIKGHNRAAEIKPSNGNDNTNMEDNDSGN
jgi:hypothetical protein